MKIIIREEQYRLLVERFPKKTEEEFLDNAKRIHQDENGNPKYDYSLVDYKNVTTNVKIICPKHREKRLKEKGVEYFEMTPSKHLEGQGCRYCYAERYTKYPEEDIENEAKKYKTTAEFKKLAFPYFNAAIKKGREFYNKITSHFDIEPESFGERFVAEILVNNGLIEESCLKTKKCKNREVTFSDCTNTIEGRYCRPLEFDFYIPELNTIIEYDGDQHFRESSRYKGKKFEATQRNDKLKNKYCLENGIKLIRIHFRFPANKIEESILASIKNPQPITFLGNYPTQ